MKEKRIFKKAVSAILAVAMVVSMTGFDAKAATVTTNVINSSSAYSYYVREAGSTSLLGIMRLSMSSSYVQNVFTASKVCKSVTVYVSNTNSGYVSNRVSSLGVNKSVIATKNVMNPSEFYGYCSVSY